MNINDLPEGSRVELNGVVYDLDAAIWHADDRLDSLTMDEMLSRSNVKILSVPYEITMHLATWLDNVYTKTGTPESLIIEAAVESKKTKDDAHISDRPKLWDTTDLGLILENKNDAQLVLNEVGKLADSYGMVPISTLMDLVGQTSTFRDQTRGWNADAIKKIAIREVNGRYTLDFPKPESLTKGS